MKKNRDIVGGLLLANLGFWAVFTIVYIVAGVIVCVHAWIEQGSE